MVSLESCVHRQFQLRVRMGLDWLCGTPWRVVSFLASCYDVQGLISSAGVGKLRRSELFLLACGLPVRSCGGYTQVGSCTQSLVWDLVEWVDR